MTKDIYTKVNLVSIVGIIDGTINIVNESMECTIFVHSTKLDLAFTKGKMILLGQSICDAARTCLEALKDDEDINVVKYIFNAVPMLEQYKGLINLSIDIKAQCGTYQKGTSRDYARAWQCVGIEFAALADENFLEVFYK